MPIHFKLVSALENIPRPAARYPASLRLSGFQNEVLSPQAAWTANEAIQGDSRAVWFETRCDVPVRVRQVIAAPVRFPASRIRTSITCAKRRACTRTCCAT